MNDPNGPIFHDGWHHLFYQHNPYADGWGNMHWGHARSRDLVNWEHLPIALWPSKSRGEDHVYSGSSAIDGNGRPVIFYTSIGNRDPEQWMARPVDDDFLVWEKVGPVVTTKTHAPLKIAEWRDPYIVNIDGRFVMLSGGSHDRKGAVSLYLPLNKEWTAWKFHGFLFTHPSLELIECPNLVKLGEKWVLYTSWGGRIDAFVGSIDPETLVLTSERSAVVAAGSYASQVSADENGRPIFYSWINVGGAVGWTGCLALPCVPGVDADGHPTLLPLPALASLRGEKLLIEDMPGVVHWAREDVGNQFEMILEIVSEGAERIDLDLSFQGTNSPAHHVSFDFKTNRLTTPRGTVDMRPSESLKLHLFLDHIVMDLFADEGRISQSMGLSREPEGRGIQLSSIGGAVKIKRMEIYKLKDAVMDLSHFE